MGKKSKSKKVAIEKEESQDKKEAGNATSSSVEAKRNINDDGVIPTPEDGENLGQYERNELSKYVNPDGSTVTIKDIVSNERIMKVLAENETFKEILKEAGLDGDESKDSDTAVKKVDDTIAAKAKDENKGEEAVKSAATREEKLPAGEMIANLAVSSESDDDPELKLDEEQRPKAPDNSGANTSEYGRAVAISIDPSDIEFVEKDYMLQPVVLTDGELDRMVVSFGNEFLTDPGSFVKKSGWTAFFYDMVKNIMTAGYFGNALEYNGLKNTTKQICVPLDPIYHVRQGHEFLDYDLRNDAFALVPRMGPVAGVANIKVMSRTETQNGIIHRLLVPPGVLTYINACKALAEDRYYGVMPQYTLNDRTPLNTWLREVYNPMILNYVRTVQQEDLFMTSDRSVKAYRLHAFGDPNVQNNFLRGLLEYAKHPQLGEELRKASFRDAYDEYKRAMMPSSARMTQARLGSQPGDDFVRAINQSAANEGMATYFALCVGGSNGCIGVELNDPMMTDEENLLRPLCGFAFLYVCDWWLIDTSTKRLMIAMTLTSLGITLERATRIVLAWGSTLPGFAYGNQLPSTCPMNNNQIDFGVTGLDAGSQAIVEQILTMARASRVTRMSDDARIYTGRVQNGNPQNELGSGYTPYYPFPFAQGTRLDAAVLALRRTEDSANTSGFILNTMCHAWAMAGKAALDRLLGVVMLQANRPVSRALGQLYSNQSRAHGDNVQRSAAAVNYLVTRAWDNLSCIPPFKPIDLARFEKAGQVHNVPINWGLSFLMCGISYSVDHAQRYTLLGPLLAPSYHPLYYRMENTIAVYVMEKVVASRYRDKIFSKSSAYESEGKRCPMLEAMILILGKVFTKMMPGVETRLEHYRDLYYLNNGANARVRAMVGINAVDVTNFTNACEGAPPEKVEDMEYTCLVSFFKPIKPYQLDCTDRVFNIQNAPKIEVWQLPNARKDKIYYVSEREWSTFYEHVRPLYSDLAVNDNVILNDANLQGLMDAMIQGMELVVSYMSVLRMMHPTINGTFRYKRLDNMTVTNARYELESMLEELVAKAAGGSIIELFALTTVGISLTTPDKTYTEIKYKKLPGDRSTEIPEPTVKIDFKDDTGEIVPTVETIDIHYAIVDPRSSLFRMNRVHTVPVSQHIENRLLVDNPATPLTAHPSVGGLVPSVRDPQAPQQPKQLLELDDVYKRDEEIVLRGMTLLQTV